jgi:hypothetical protein
VQAESLEVVLSSFELADGVPVYFLQRKFGEGAFLAVVGVGRVVAEFVEHGADRVWLVARPVRLRLLAGDQLGDLFEFDDVGTVGDDPVASAVLCARGRREVLVHLCWNERGVGDPVDELSLVGGRGRQELLQFGLPAVELRRSPDDDRDGRCVVSIDEPTAVLEDPQHRLLPPVGDGGVVWSGSESGWVVGDVVEESVSGDAVGGVVPDGGAGCVGWSCR